MDVYGDLVSVYGFDGLYTPAQTMDPGFGYWVNLSTSGQVDLSGQVAPVSVAKAVASEAAPAIQSTGSILWLVGANGQQQPIQLGVSEDAIAVLPPVPPPNLFDARVLVDGVGTWCVPTGDESATFLLRLQGGVDVIRWEIPAEQWGQWALQVDTRVIPLTGTGSGDVSTSSTVWVQRSERVPSASSLAANYPNPFNPSTAIRYDLQESGPVSLRVYDITGQVVSALVSDEQPAGRYTITWDGRNQAGAQVASGVYLYELRAGSFRSVQKMLLMK